MAGTPATRDASPSALEAFNNGWSFTRGASASWDPVHLPHDAMIAEKRSSEAGTGNHGGYFPGGIYRYKKEWKVPDDVDQREYSLLFEGVYGVTTVSVDGDVVGESSSGYREFRIPLHGLKPRSTAQITVDVDNTKTPNSRWYTGAGIYRPVWIESAPSTRIAPDGTRVLTRKISAIGAEVEVEVHVTGAWEGLAATVEVGAEGFPTARGQAEVRDGVATIAINVQQARAWSADDPFLYEVAVRLLNDADVVDENRMRTGLRTIEVDAVHGLRVNGDTVLLRGACVHHDNGIIGAVTFATAERRRARILKEAGYNAVRSAHNPLSREFLDACDEYGLYVMDELTDVWFQHKTQHDAADRFETVWQDDARAMVAKNRNRPSVIIHSIGNEIAETATERGIDAASRIAQFISELDPSRPTTLAVNLLLNLMASKGKSAFDREQSAPNDEKKKPTSTAANMLTAKLGRVMELVSRLPAADKASREAFATVDVAGYNYAYGRYRGDRKKYPRRVIVGSESMPGDLPKIWRQVRTVPGVIGDFMWTGWDYLGEAGIGAWSYGDTPGGLNKPYPALVAGPGAIDITGLPGAPLFLAQAVWGHLTSPVIAVRPLDHVGEKTNRTPWRTSDAVPSWSWHGLSGLAEIEVYSNDDEVELFLNGRSLGRKRAGEKASFITRFKTPYEPGELTAVGYRGNAEVGRTTLQSAGEIAIDLRAEPISHGDDLIYVWAELSDSLGIVDDATNDHVTVRVEGPAELVGLGSADPSPEGSFADDAHDTYRGRALAILRLTGSAGTVTVRVTSIGHGDTELHIPVPAAG